VVRISSDTVAAGQRRWCRHAGDKHLSFFLIFFSSTDILFFSLCSKLKLFFKEKLRIILNLCFKIKIQKECKLFLPSSLPLDSVWFRSLLLNSVLFLTKGDRFLCMLVRCCCWRIRPLMIVRLTTLKIVLVLNCEWIREWIWQIWKQWKKRLMWLWVVWCKWFLICVWFVWFVLLDF